MGDKMQNIEGFKKLSPGQELYLGHIKEIVLDRNSAGGTKKEAMRLVFGFYRNYGHLVVLANIGSKKLGTKWIRNRWIIADKHGKVEIEIFGKSYKEYWHMYKFKASVYYKKREK